MNQTQTFLSSDLQMIELDQSNCTVQAIHKIANRNYEYFFDFHGHSLSSYFCEFLAQLGPNRPSGTLVAFCHAFARLLECFEELGYETLNAESFSAYTNWLKRVESRRTSVRFRESTRRGYGNSILKFMEWLVDGFITNPKEVATARLRHQKAMRGSSARLTEQLRLKAVSPEDYINLIRAIRLEYEECKKLLQNPRRGS